MTKPSQQPYIYFALKCFSKQFPQGCIVLKQIHQRKLEKLQKKEEKYKKIPFRL